MDDFIVRRALPLSRTLKTIIFVVTVWDSWCPYGVHKRCKTRQIQANWWGKKISWKTYLRRVFRFWTYSWDLA